MSKFKIIFASLLVFMISIGSATAATDSGCYVVVNVAPGDSLNMRSRPSARGSIVDRLIPGRHGIISANGRCRPNTVSWPKRWCPVRHHSGDYPTTSGWVKARYISGSGCP